MTAAKVKTKCLEAAQLLARLAAADENGYCECVTCGVVKHYKDGMHGGHFIPKGSSNRWCLEPENIHPQCAADNMYGMRNGTAAQAYTVWMIDYYGRDFVDHMIATKRDPVKRYKKDYEDILAELKEQIKYHEQRIG
jgi:hypothetical protein